MSSDQDMKHSSPKNQGEGDRKSSRSYNKATEKFVKSGKVEDAARKAAEQDPREAAESERAGRERAKEVDPEVHRNYKKAEK